MSVVERLRMDMSVTLTHTGTRGAALLADPVVEPNRPVVPRRAVGKRAVVPAITPRDLSRVRVGALQARIDVLERRLAAAERRHDVTIERYERILERRTDRFRSWVRQGDPRPEEFTWLGRSGDATVESVTDGTPTSNESTVEPVWDGTADPVQVGTVGVADHEPTGEQVATDGGRDRSRAFGFLSRLLEYVGSAIR